MAIGAIAAIGGAFQAATSLFGIRGEAGTHEPASGADAALADLGGDVPDDADFAPGAPYFEAVASALDAAGYRDA